MHILSLYLNRCVCVCVCVCMHFILQTKKKKNTFRCISCHLHTGNKIIREVLNKILDIGETSDFNHNLFFLFFCINHHL